MKFIIMSLIALSSTGIVFAAPMTLECSSKTADSTEYTTVDANIDGKVESLTLISYNYTKDSNVPPVLILGDFTSSTPSSQHQKVATFTGNSNLAKKVFNLQVSKKIHTLDGLEDETVMTLNAKRKSIKPTNLGYTFSATLTIDPTLSTSGPLTVNCTYKRAKSIP